MGGPQGDVKTPCLECHQDRSQAISGPQRRVVLDVKNSLDSDFGGPGVSRASLEAIPSAKRKVTTVL